MKYTVYKTSNLINGKFYIGTHKTNDPNDSYLGSGTILKHAIAKHGIESFKKEVLFVFDNSEDMFAKEAELVTEEFLSEENTYNLKVGGFGGFEQSIMIACRNTKYPNGVMYGKKHSVETRAKMSLTARDNPSPGFTGKKHSDKTKRLMTKQNRRFVGSKNSQYGSMWIADGSDNQKIKSDGVIPDGWRRGRIIS